MGYTLESIISLLGDLLQRVGGTLMVYDGKHIVLGQQDNSTGVLTLTEEGKAWLDDFQAPKKAAAPSQTTAPAGK